MTDPYQTPAAVESAIRSAAQKAAQNDKSLSTQERIRLEYFHRFLCRIFSETPTDAWLLKGGTALLARVPSARATSDVDLFNRRHSLAAALTELRRLAALDLGDFFRFEYVSHTDSLGGKQQAYTEGIRVSFDVYLGVNKKDRLNVDLVVKAVTTETPETIIPSNVLTLPKLPQCEYRLYPLVDQMADKVCATLSLYNGHPSTRVKDLVDLVVLTLTRTPSMAAALRWLSPEKQLPEGYRSRRPSRYLRTGMPPTEDSPPPSRTARTTSPSHWPRASSMRCWNRCLPGRPRAYGGIPGFAHGFEPAWERNTRSSARHG